MIQKQIMLHTINVSAGIQSAYNLIYIRYTGKYVTLVPKNFDSLH